ncbi:MAG: TolC family protein, partial [Bacteroidales bacterium]|nr:TolC family protein [Bacteroidales bacterium]
MTRKIGYCIAFFLISCMSISAQDSTQVTLMKKLTLDQVVQLAREQSLAAILAKHRFRSSYWSNRSFKANYLPSLNFTSQAMPTVTKAYDKVV